MALSLIGGAAMAVALLSSPASSSATAPFDIYDEHEVFYPEGDWNGYKVFLSSPRHSNSGDRGECLGGARLQENVNGRMFGHYAAVGPYIDGTFYVDSPRRNLTARGYRVQLSKNKKDDGYLNNRAVSQNWGSDVHIVSHTNAANSNGCPNDASFILGEYNSNHDDNLVSAILSEVAEKTPGGRDKKYDTWAELYTDAPRGDAYMELVFHTNRDDNLWMAEHSYKQASWRYGLAVDKHLNYP